LGTGPRPIDLPERATWVSLAADAEGRVAWPSLLEWCGSQGLHDLLVEPGPRLLASILRHGVWNSLWVLRSDRDLPGGLPADPTGLLPQEAPASVRDLGDDTASFWTSVGFRPIPPLS